jgi:transposase InsO family protein
VARIYTPSERARALELADDKGVTAAARELGISRFSIYAWQRRLKLFNDGTSETSPLEGSDEDVEAQREARILDTWKTHPGLGPSQVRNQLRRAGMKVSVHRTRRVMEANGYVPPTVKRRNVHDRRYEAVRPNHLFHLDFLHRYINKLHVYVLLILDDYSRFIVGARLWEGERVDIVIDTFEAATQRHGRPEMAMSDGGSAFWSWRGVSRFTRLLEEMGVEQLIAKVPQTNGKLEVLNANLQKELFNVERFFDLERTRQRFESWVAFYNFRRTHHALGGLLVPADRYFGRSEAVLAQIEAGGTPDGIGEPLPVSQRHLDLLRVSSKGGEVELYLMGQRLWPPPARR